MLPSESISISAFATAQLALLARELDAEKASTSLLLDSAGPKTLARAGLAILNLNVSSLRTGLGGKTVFELETDSSISGSSKVNDSTGSKDTNSLGQHDIRVGDIVRVAPQPKGAEKKREKAGLDSKGVDGVVVKIGARAVQVAVDRGEEAIEEGSGTRVKLANEVTYKRMNWTMDRIQKMGESDHTTLMRILFGLESPSPLPSDLENSELGPGKIEFLDPTLNDSQKDAVRFALAAREIALIHGPPGTGKTYTLIELIRQLLQQGKRILVCGPSNISVDNIVERLAPCKVPMIRLGHPARLLPSVLNHSLDVLTRTSEAAELVKDIRKEMDDKQASIRKTRNGRERKAIYGEIKDLRGEYREREKKCVTTLVHGSKVVLATLHGAGGSQVRHERFDVIIIDEASQALEAQCWIPLLTASKVILAGDHLQLPPTVKSSNTKGSEKKSTTPLPKEFKGMSLEFTLFDRLLALYGSSVKRMLTTQYRMHEIIMRFPSDMLYEGKLVAADAVSRRLLSELTYPVEATEDTITPLIFYDTQGGDFPEQIEEDEGTGKISKSTLLGDSKSNPNEALLVVKHVESLIDAGVNPEDIAVVTPYNAQLALLSEQLKQRFPGLELGSVDGFQGREKEAIIFSLVRSNPEHEIGFLSERRRLNVAMTRPKRHLCVIGDSETIVRGGSFLKAWMKHLEDHADLRYPDLADLGM